MDNLERDFIYQNGKRIEEYENTPREFVDPYSDMTTEEKSKLILMLQDMLRQRDEVNDQLNNKIDEMLRCQTESNSQIAKLTDLLSKVQQSNLEKEKRIEELLKKISDLEADKKKARKDRFGSSSQKSKQDDSNQTKNRKQDKDDFDGTPGSSDFDATCDQEIKEDQDKRKPGTDAQKLAGLLRQGTRNRKSGADVVVYHDSDLSKLPQGAVFISYEDRYAYDQKTITTEHHYRLVTYKLNGRFYTKWLPSDGEPQSIDKVPGSHVSASFMAQLAFDKYFLHTPFYREHQKLNDQGLHIRTPKTLRDWLGKGSQKLAPVVDILTEQMMCEDAVINCDETWTKVRVNDKYRNRYIWCLVNRKAKIVIFRYEKGSRGREALKKIIGKHKIKAIQSDGYNVYYYLDADDSLIEHICCMAHARAKYVYAAEAGDRDAQYILDCIEELYVLEALYLETGLSEEEIGKARKNARTLEIIGKIRSKLDTLVAPDHPPRGELMEKAINYMMKFWDQLFRYTENGAYSIDNNIAERQIRPLANERKNSLFFGSHVMAGTSAIYHSIMATCKMMGISIMEYLTLFFEKYVAGERDYNKLLPQTIGLQHYNPDSDL